MLDWLKMHLDIAIVASLALFLAVSHFGPMVILASEDLLESLRAAIPEKRRKEGERRLKEEGGRRERWTLEERQPFLFTDGERTGCH